jgi:NADH-quinone oxidoreductase subunit C
VTDPQIAGGALAARALVPVEEAPRTVAVVPRTGVAASASATVLQAHFPDAIGRIDVIWGETTVFVAREALHQVVRHLRDAEGYDYLVDITAVEYREPGRPLEVVWHLRALARRRFLRLKVELSPGDPLVVDSVTDLYSGANWLERECFDMFGVRFHGHPDLRRLLMWEGYREGYPLRKDFPLRGRLSRADQLAEVLSAAPESRYSMEELSIAEAFDDLPEEMRARLAARRSSATGGDA